MKKLLLLLPLILLASVKVSVNKTHLIKGEDLIITITAEGKNVIFPNLNKIAGFEVIGNSESSNIVIINGNVKESVSKSYIIMPDRNFTIPSFSVSVNGKVFKTKPIHITVSIPKQTKGDYTLDINLSKTKA
ncbi:BatD family protein, partial [Caminibacter sp.]